MRQAIVVPVLKHLWLQVDTVGLLATWRQGVKGDSRQGFWIDLRPEDCLVTSFERTQQLLDMAWWSLTGRAVGPIDGNIPRWDQLPKLDDDCPAEWRRLPDHLWWLDTHPLQTIPMRVEIDETLVELVARLGDEEHRVVVPDVALTRHGMTPFPIEDLRWIRG